MARRVIELASPVVSLAMIKSISRISGQWHWIRLATDPQNLRALWHYLYGENRSMEKNVLVFLSIFLHCRIIRARALVFIKYVKFIKMSLHIFRLTSTQFSTRNGSCFVYLRSFVCTALQNILIIGKSYIYIYYKLYIIL